MSGQDEDTEKSHEPTQRKLDQARKKGEVAKSADISVAASYAGLLVALLATGSTSALSLGQNLMVLIEQSDEISLLVFSESSRTVAGGIGVSVLRSVLPWFVVPAMAVLLSILAQRSFLFTPSKLEFKGSRLNPIQNAKNKFGRSGLFEFSKSFVKLLVYSICLASFLRARLPEMVGSLQASPSMVAAELGRLCLEFMLVVLAVAIVIGAIDYLWQYQEHTRKNRMSRKELTDEAKESEGDPHLKQKRRQRAQEIAMSQMMADVPTADVIIVNPTHYAIALKWSREPGKAPVCVAKGVDETAHRIRKIAHEAAVPVHSDPPVARALYATTDIGQEIAPDHYRAVAAAIKFAEAMRKRARR